MRFATAVYLLGLIVCPRLAWAQFPGPVVGLASHASNPGTPPQTLVSTAISCGSSCYFTAGTGGAVGTFSATLSPSSPGFSGSWSLQTSGTVGGHACDNSGYFSVSGSSLNVSSSGVTGTFYPCYVATKSGLAGSPLANVATVTGNGSVSANFVANFNDVHQTMDGFGGSDVGSPYTASQMDEFYCINANDPGCGQAGIGLTFLRQGLGSSDGGITQEPWDPSYLTNAQEAVARGGTVWLSEWTASTSNYQGSAQGIINAIQSNYINNGIHLYVVSTQNEPDCGCNGGNGWNSSQTAGFADVLGPMLHGLSPPVKLSSPETAFPQDFNGYVSAIEGDPTANAQVDIFSTHQYGDITSIGQVDGTRHAWETEQGDACSGQCWDPSISNAVNGMSQWLYDSIVTVGMSAWHNWNLGCGNPCNYGINGGDTNNVANITKRYFALGNWSKFVRPGWVRIGVTGSQGGFYGVAAFKNPSTGAFAIIAINNSGGDISNVTFGISGASVTGSVTPWVTSGTAIGQLGTDGNLSDGSSSSGVPTSIAVSGGVFTSTVPYGVTTFVGQVQ